MPEWAGCAGRVRAPLGSGPRSERCVASWLPCAVRDSEGHGRQAEGWQPCSSGSQTRRADSSRARVRALVEVGRLDARPSSGGAVARGADSSARDEEQRSHSLFPDALDFAFWARPLDMQESWAMDPHIASTTAGEAAMNEPAPEPTRKHIPGLGSIYRRGERWAIEFWKDGLQHRESARTTNEMEAIAHLRMRVEERAQDMYIGPRAERVTVMDLLALFAQDYATTGNRSSRTLKFRVAALESELGHLRAVNVSSRAVEAYKAKRLAGGS